MGEPDAGAPATATSPPPAPSRPPGDSTWADYTTRTRRLWWLLGPGLLVVLAAARLLLVERYGWHGWLWPLAGWAAALALSGLHLQAFLCPRCQRHYFRQRPRLLALRAQRCMHCCLPKD